MFIKFNVTLLIISLSINIISSALASNIYDDLLPIIGIGKLV
jgi:hypothetical protein